MLYLPLHHNLSPSHTMNTKGGMAANAVAACVSRPQQTRRREGKTAAQGQEEERTGGLAGLGDQARHSGRGMHHIAPGVLDRGGQVDFTMLY